MMKFQFMTRLSRLDYLFATHVLLFLQVVMLVADKLNTSPLIL